MTHNNNRKHGTGILTNYINGVVNTNLRYDMNIINRTEILFTND